MSVEGPKSPWTDGAQTVGHTVLRGILMAVAVRTAEFAMDQIGRGGKAIWNKMFTAKIAPGKPPEPEKAAEDGAKAKVPPGKKKGAAKEEPPKEEPAAQAAS